MNTVSCLDLITNKTFTLTFYDLRKQRNFLVKCRYSKKLLVIDFTYQSQSEYEYLVLGR